MSRGDRRRAGVRYGNNSRSREGKQRRSEVVLVEALYVGGGGISNANDKYWLITQAFVAVTVYRTCRIPHLLGQPFCNSFRIKSM